MSTKISKNVDLTCIEAVARLLSVFLLISLVFVSIIIDVADPFGFSLSSLYISVPFSFCLFPLHVDVFYIHVCIVFMRSVWNVARKVKRGLNA